MSVALPVFVHDIVAVGAALVVAALAALYVAGLRRLARRGHPWQAVKRRHAASFGLGLLALLLALASPLDTLGMQLFMAAMGQHILLLMAAPLLLLVARPVIVLPAGLPRAVARHSQRMLRALRAPWLRWVPRMLSSPFVAWPLYVTDAVAWHVPPLYEAALHDVALHQMQNLCFLATGLLFWWVVVEPLPDRAAPRLHQGLRVGLRLITIWLSAGANTGLGLFLALKDTPLYATYAGGAWARPWGLSALDDQRLAGVILWVLGGLIYLAAAGLFFIHLMTPPPDPDELDPAEIIAQAEEIIGRAASR